MNTFKVACYILAVSVLFFSSQTGLAQKEKVDLIVTGGHFFDTDEAVFKFNKGIAIRAGRFVSLEAGDQFEADALLELDETHYILPGLVDCHAHYNVKLIKKRREEYLAMPVVYLANGITTTFSCGEYDPEQMLKLRKDMEAGNKVGPNLINSGPYFGRARPGWRGIRTEEEIKADVDFWAEQGAGGFKAKAISPSELEALCKHAKRHGLTVTGHLDSGFRNSVNPADAIDLGIDRIEHFLGGDGMPNTRSAYSSLARITTDMPEYKAVVKKFIDTETVFDATLTAYGYFGIPGEEYEQWIDERQFFTPYIQELVKSRPEQKPMMQFQEIYEAKLKTIGAFHDAGGTITMGTDHFSNGNYLPGFGAHRELDAFVRAGIPAADAIKIGTINGATALGIDAEYGSIDTDKVADLFVVEGNPMDNIRNTRNVQKVIRAGKVHDAAELLESVKGKLGPKDESEAGDW